MAPKRMYPPLAGRRKAAGRWRRGCGCCPWADRERGHGAEEGRGGPELRLGKRAAAFKRLSRERCGGPKAPKPIARGSSSRDGGPAREGASRAAAAVDENRRRPSGAGRERRRPLDSPGDAARSAKNRRRRRARSSSGLCGVMLDGSPGAPWFPSACLYKLCDDRAAPPALPHSGRRRRTQRRRRAARCSWTRGGLAGGRRRNCSRAGARNGGTRVSRGKVSSGARRGRCGPGPEEIGSRSGGGRGGIRPRRGRAARAREARP